MDSQAILTVNSSVPAHRWSCLSGPGACLHDFDERFMVMAWLNDWTDVSQSDMEPSPGKQNWNAQVIATSPKVYHGWDPIMQLPYEPGFSLWVSSMHQSLWVYGIHSEPKPPRGGWALPGVPHASTASGFHGLGKLKWVHPGYLNKAPVIIIIDANNIQ